MIPAAQASQDIAQTYQPRRLRAAGIMVTWNLLLLLAFVGSGAALRLQHLLGRLPIGAEHLSRIAPIYLALLFIAHAIVNYPLELWFGYLQERHYHLAKNGIRHWSRDWLIGVTHHAVLFLAGSCALLALQVLVPRHWVLASSLLGLALCLVATWRATDLIPGELFQFEPASPQLLQRLAALAAPLPLPPVVIFGGPTLRDFSGGLIGLGRRQILLLSQSAIERASDATLRFALLHELGHKKFRHGLTSALLGWAYISLGLTLSNLCVPHSFIATPIYIAALAVPFSLWMALGEPLLAFLGRRMEYAADRFYLRHGGTVSDMRTALAEISHQNVARTERLARRQTILHPLPSVANRLFAANRYADRLGLATQEAT